MSAMPGSTAHLLGRRRETTFDEEEVDPLSPREAMLETLRERQAAQQQQQQQQQQQYTTKQQQQQQPHIYRPIPRRNFSTTSQRSDKSLLDHPASPDLLRHLSSHSNTHDEQEAEDFLAQLNARLLRTNSSNNALGVGNGSLGVVGNEDGEEGPTGTGITKSQSFLNAKSTLFGIMGEGDGSVSDTPWGVGAETPGLDMDATPGHEYLSAMGNADSGRPDGGLNMMSSKRIMRSGNTIVNGHTKTRGMGRTEDSKPQRRPLSRRTSSYTPGHKRGVWRFVAISGKLLSLFLFGAVYGVIVSHLHDTRELAAVNVGGVDRHSWNYVAGWGIAGLVFGTLLPYVDLMTDGSGGNGGPGGQGGQEPESPGRRASHQHIEKGAETSAGEKMNELLRSVAAFAGIAFAIRRLPWESTLQLTLTLALVNPALWYILDRTRIGLAFSFITTTLITSFIFLSNPDVLPKPALLATSTSLLNSSSSGTHIPSSSSSAEEKFAGVISYDHLATATWVGSVIFCSCICFGGIGRRSAVLEEWGWGVRTRS